VDINKCQLPELEKCGAWRITGLAIPALIGGRFDLCNFMDRLYLT